MTASLLFMLVNSASPTDQNNAHYDDMVCLLQHCMPCFGNSPRVMYNVGGNLH